MPDWQAIPLIAIIVLVVVLTIAGALIWDLRRIAVRASRTPARINVWEALWPDFLGFTRRDGRVNSDRGTNRTLNLLTAVTLVFLLAIALWALAAGILRTAWLYSCSPDGFAASTAHNCKITFETGAAQGQHGWYIFTIVLLFEAVRAVCGVLAIGLAAGLIGATVGFLFGIPRYGEAPSQPAAAQAGTAAAQQRAVTRLQLNTNLIRISDWLANGLAVLTLVQVRPAASQFLELTVGAANWLFDGRHGSPALMAAAIAGTAVLGFLYASIYTQLIITPLLAAVDNALRLPGTEPTARALMRDGLQSLLIDDELLAPQISRTDKAPEPTRQPSPEALHAAHQYDDITLEDLIGDANGHL